MSVRNRPAFICYVAFLCYKNKESTGIDNLIKGYRVESGLVVRGMAIDVINYEEQELGNDGIGGVLVWVRNR